MTRYCYSRLRRYCTFSSPLTPDSADPRREPVHNRRFVALCSPSLARRLAAALTADGFELAVAGAEQLLEALQGPTSVGVIIDPSLLTVSTRDAALALLQQAPRPAVVYAPVSADGVQGAVAFARASAATVLFQSGEEDFQSLMQAIVAGVHPVLATRVLQGIAPELGRLPPVLRESISSMFAADALPETPLGLARRAAVSRRSLDRWLDRAGLVPARRLVAAPPLVRALGLLWDTRLSLRRIAFLCRYRSARRLHDHALELTGRDPLSIRAMGPADELLEHLIAQLREAGARSDVEGSKTGTDDARRGSAPTRRGTRARLDHTDRAASRSDESTGSGAQQHEPLHGDAA